MSSLIDSVFSFITLQMLAVIYLIHAPSTRQQTQRRHCCLEHIEYEDRQWISSESEMCTKVCFTDFPSHQLCICRVMWLEATSKTKDLSNILLHVLPLPRQKRIRMHSRKSSERTETSCHTHPPFQYEFRRHCVLV